MSRIPRPTRNGETVTRKRADELTADDYGRIVQHPGNRGWLRNAEVLERGVWVCTTTGVAVYPNDSEFVVWGYDERDAVRRRWEREHAARKREYASTPQSGDHDTHHAGG